MVCGKWRVRKGCKSHQNGSMRGEALEFGGEFREIKKENTFVCYIVLG